MFLHVNMGSEKILNVFLKLKVKSGSSLRSVRFIRWLYFFPKTPATQGYAPSAMHIVPRRRRRPHQSASTSAKCWPATTIDPTEKGGASRTAPYVALEAKEPVMKNKLVTKTRTNNEVLVV